MYLTRHHSLFRSSLPLIGGLEEASVCLNFQHCHLNVVNKLRMTIIQTFTAITTINPMRIYLFPTKCSLQSLCRPWASWHVEILSNRALEISTLSPMPLLDDVRRGSRPWEMQFIDSALLAIQFLRGG